MGVHTTRIGRLPRHPESARSEQSASACGLTAGPRTRRGDEQRGAALQRAAERRPRAVKRGLLAAGGAQAGGHTVFG